tara:strand:- start:530 stop:1183 length:654 start_codon:yes stop_codon:yes gene_type:complete
MTEKINVNIGCSTTPTTGWKNYDNSQAIFLAKFGIFADLFFKLRFISDHQYKVVNFYRKNKVVWADVTKYLPLESNTVNAIYSSHMFEHLDKDEAKKCLLEMRRVLEPGGILRLALPNMRKYIDEYLNDKDLDKLIETSCLGTDKPKSIIEKIKYFLSGPRHHLWMYDENSLSKLLEEYDFRDIEVLKPGQTNIEKYGDLNLREREDDSFYIEARKY